MELTTEEKLDRLKAGLAAIGNRLAALEAAQREGLAQWEADRARWAADESAAWAAELWDKAREGERTLTLSELLDRLSVLGINEGQIDGLIEAIERLPYIETSDDLDHTDTRGSEVSYPRVVVSKEGWPANPAEVSEAAVNEEEERQFSEAMQRLDMCSDGGGVAAAVAEDAKGEAECGVDRSFYFPRTDAERRGGRLSWPNLVALTDEKRWSWDR